MANASGKTFWVCCQISLTFPLPLVKKYNSSCVPEAYLEPSQKSAIELFCINS